MFVKSLFAPVKIKTPYRVQLVSSAPYYKSPELVILSLVPLYQIMVGHSTAAKHIERTTHC